MDRLIDLLASESCSNLLSALVHTLWQGALAAGVLFLYLRRTPAAAANKRYVASLAALGAIVLSALLTWSILSYQPAKVPSALSPLPGITARDATSNSMVSGLATSPDIGIGLKTVGQSHAWGSRQVWIMAAWLAGVALMFLRLAALVMGASRLRRQCRVIEDPQTLDLVEQLRDRMGIGRRARILVGDPISTPGVVGCFWPTLLLPASLISGIPAEDLQAILTHELAHIRRYDYLVNFFQMVVEALLFFNPAVWWISRQIRIEREACCDMAGVLWTGQRHKYAEVLVAWAQRRGESRGGTPAPAVGFGQDLGGGNILDRVRRILIAGHQPQPRVPWHMATAMLVLSLACLVVLQQATGLAVNLAGRILTPQERIHQIAEISKEYGHQNQESGPEGKIEISGVVRTWDGAPLSGRPSLLLECAGRLYSSSIGVGVSREGTFRASIPRGSVYLVSSAEGYAPAFAGPFEARRGEAIQGIELVLGVGFPGRIRVTDESGQPVPGAELAGGYPYRNSGSYHYTIKLTTDANGSATLDHAAAQNITLRITARGFQSTRVEGLVPDPNQIRIVTLRKEQPTGGMVVAQTTGRPIADAKVHILALAQENRHETVGYLQKSPDAVTDAEGRFELHGLRSDWKYLLLVRAPGYGYQYVPDVVAADRNLRVVLGEKKIIRGKVIGDLSLLSRGADAVPTISAQSRYQYPGFSGSVDVPTKIPVTLRDDIGYFQVDDFWGQTVTLSAGVPQVSLDVEKDRLDDVLIDLRPEARRQVVLQFQTPPDAPPIEGSVGIDYMTRRPIRDVTSNAIAIRDNQAECEVPVPCRLRYGINFFRGNQPVGYWFQGSNWIDIPPGDGPFTIDVRAHPAGAVYGKILRSDGSIAEKAGISVKIVQEPDLGLRQGHLPPDLSTLVNNSVQCGTFNVTPLPLGGVYAVVAYEDYAFAMSDAFALDEKNPIVNVDLQLPQGVDVVGRLLDVDGTPARNDVNLHVSVQRGEHSWGVSGIQIQPDEAGRFVFKNVNAGSRGECAIRVIGGAGYRPVVRQIKDLRSPVVIQLEKGHRVTGSVIDDVTRWPVPNVEVYAFAVEGPDGQVSRDWEMLEADGRTEEQGRFTFSNMAASYYSLNIRSANLADPLRPVIVTGGQSDPAVLRIRIPEWSDLKPRQP